eukprot:1271579-Alexandrium_andersonii.AAC.1
MAERRAEGTERRRLRNEALERDPWPGMRRLRVAQTLARGRVTFERTVRHKLVGQERAWRA